MPLASSTRTMFLVHADLLLIMPPGFTTLPREMEGRILSSLGQ